MFAIGFMSRKLRIEVLEDRRLLALSPRLVLDVESQVAGLGSDPSHFAVLDDVAFFSANDGVSGHELWKTDGTAHGTVRVKDIRRGYEGSTPANFAVAGGKVFFTIDDGLNVELWTSDGTEAGTVAVRAVSPTRWQEYLPRIAALGSIVVFTVEDEEAGHVVWRSDGTAAGTWQVKDVNPEADTYSELYGGFTRSGDLLYFWADHPTGTGLWKTDGTTAGTVKVREFSFLSTYRPPLTDVNGVVYFAAGLEDSGYELWKSNGTTAGTVMVKELVPGAVPDSLFGGPFALTNVSGTLYFTHPGVAGPNALWKSNGTPQGTVKIADLPGGVAFDRTYSTRITDFNGDAYFWVGDSSYDLRLWKSNGTAAGTGPLLPELEGAWGDDAPLIEVVDGQLIFEAKASLDAANGFWRSDGTAAGTVRYADSLRQDTYLNFRIALNGKLLMSLDDDQDPYDGSPGRTGLELWTTDGTAAGTHLLKDIYPRTYDSSPGDLRRSRRHRCLFSGRRRQYANVRTLWRTDGTANGTWKIEGDWTQQDSASTAFGDAAFVGDTLFFPAPEGTTAALWKSTGLLHEAVLVKDIFPGPGGSRIHNLTNVGGVLYFTGGGFSARDLWKSDGTEAGTVLVKANLGNASNLIDVGGRLFFTAEDTATGIELWTSDGTGAGTFRVKDIYGGTLSSSPVNLTALGNRVFFSAADASTSRELWTSDGTEAGTYRVKDIRAGTQASSPLSDRHERRAVLHRSRPNPS